MNGNGWENCGTWDHYRTAAEMAAALGVPERMCAAYLAACGKAKSAAAARDRLAAQIAERIRMDTATCSGR